MTVGEGAAAATFHDSRPRDERRPGYKRRSIIQQRMDERERVRYLMLRNRPKPDFGPMSAEWFRKYDLWSGRRAREIDAALRALLDILLMPVDENPLGEDWDDDVASPDQLLIDALVSAPAAPPRLRVLAVAA